MHKSILTLLLIITSTSITADESNWTFVSISEAKGSKINTTYIDLSTIRIQGNRRKIWQLIDIDDPAQKVVKSIKMLNEYDCKEETGRTIYGLVYSASMGKGDGAEAQSEEDKAFKPVIPNTSNSKIFKITCDKNG